MVEAFMYAGIGFLLASVIAWGILPIVHVRAVRLTERRIAAEMPSMSEVTADKDHLRAKFALAARCYEVNIEQMKSDTAAKLADFGKRSETLAKLKQQVGVNGETIAKLETDLGTKGAALAKLESELGVKSETIAMLETKLGTRSETIAQLKDEIGANGETIANLKGELGSKGRAIARLESELGARDEAVAALQATLGTKSETIAKLESEPGNKKAIMREMNASKRAGKDQLRTIKEKPSAPLTTLPAAKVSSAATAKARRTPAARASRGSGELANRMRALQSLQTPTTAVPPVQAPAQRKTGRPAPRRNAARSVPQSATAARGAASR
jgi:chromosome segregation ATPase